MTCMIITQSPRNKNQRQFSVVDRSARAPMKNAASCEKQCELQNTLIIGILNAHGGLGLRGPNLVRLRVVNKTTNRVCAARHVRAIARVIRTRNLTSCPARGGRASTLGANLRRSLQRTAAFLACSSLCTVLLVQRGQGGSGKAEPAGNQQAFRPVNPDYRHLESKGHLCRGGKPLPGRSGEARS